VTTYDEYRLLGFTDADREDTERLTVDPYLVAELAGTLRRQIGTFPPDSVFEPSDGLAALAAYLETVPDVRAFHASRDVDDEISWGTLADLGRQLDVHRRTHGRFGLETHWWLRAHWFGSLYQLGRLQFLLTQEHRGAPGVEPGEWVLDVHIPESGPLDPAAIDDSFAQAKDFFATRFPEKPVRTATLLTWLLDPVLVEWLPAESNLSGFARRFTLYGEPLDGAASAVYFTFRTRDTDHLDRLPRDTQLQRLVLDRVGGGHGWQNAHGYLRL
jgi:hypothetical protein